MSKPFTREEFEGLRDSLIARRGQGPLATTFLRLIATVDARDNTLRKVRDKLSMSPGEAVDPIASAGARLWSIKKIEAELAGKP